MNRLILVGGAALVSIAGVAVAQTAVSTPDRSAEITRQQVVDRVGERFARLDVDSDGRVTPDEARQARERFRTERAGRMFDHLDLDRNGSITREEMSRAHAQRRERRAERGEAAERREMRGMRGMRGHGGGGFHGPRQGRAAAMFGEQGFITREQMQAQALARFDRQDTDRNGVVTAEERGQARAQRRERRQAD